MTNAPRIATVTLNPAIDQTALVPNFTAGAVNRVPREQSDAGGKGVNVASFLATSVCRFRDTACSGTPIASRSSACSARRASSIGSCGCPVSTRVNVKIVDEAQDRVDRHQLPGPARAR